MEDIIENRRFTIGINLKNQSLKIIIMKIYTGNFANIKKYREANLFPISIALTARYFTGIRFKALNPDREWMMEEESSYTPKFNAKLENLCPLEISKELAVLSNNQDVILLCHEGEQDFCHRHLVAAWLMQNLNIEVVELGKMQKPHQQIKNITAELV